MKASATTPCTRVNLATFMYFCLSAFCLIASPASAQNVITDLSNRDVSIEWDFNGAKILLFGAIDTAEVVGSRHDVVIAVQGPKTQVLVRKKSRIAGIWVNNKAESFNGVPGYYSIVSTRPLSSITSKKTLAALRLGANHLQIKPKNSPDSPSSQTAANSFKQAITRIKTKEGLFKEEPGGVTIIGDRLFRANITLPVNVPVGRFTADVYLFRDGKLVSRELSSLYIQKQGIEQKITTMAYDYPFLYGVICVVIAVLAGLSASLFTRRG